MTTIEDKIKEKFAKDYAILQTQSNGQEELSEPFQCYKTGYFRGQDDARVVFYNQGFNDAMTSRTTTRPIEVEESKDITTEAFKSMPKETYEAYIAKKAKQEQLAEDMRKFKKLFVDNENDDPFEVTLEDVLHALQQSKAKSD